MALNFCYCLTQVCCGSVKKLAQSHQCNMLLLLLHQKVREFVHLQKVECYKTKKEVKLNKVFLFLSLASRITEIVTHSKLNDF